MCTLQNNELALDRPDSLETETKLFIGEEMLNAEVDDGHEGDADTRELINLLESDLNELKYGCLLRIANKGRFYWRPTEESLLDEIVQKTIALLPPENRQHNDKICAALSAIFKIDESDVQSNDEVRKKVDAHLSGWGMQLQWTGTYPQLCQSPDECAAEIRKEFRKAGHYFGAAQANALLSEEMKMPIQENHLEYFHEYLATYGRVINLICE